MSKKIISFEATEDLKEALRTTAFQKETSVSAVIREILEREVLQNSLWRSE